MTSPFLPTEVTEQVGVIDPQSDTSTVRSTGWIKADSYESYLAQIVVGAMTATGTIDAKIEQANTSGGGGVKDVTGKALTQVLAASGGSKSYAINVRPSDLDTANSFFWFRLTITPTTAASLLMGQILGIDPKRRPVPQTNWTQVK